MTSLIQGSSAPIDMQHPVPNDSVTSSDVLALFVVVIVALVLDFAFAQRVPLDSRFHWDGTYYLAYAKDIGPLLASKSIDEYSLSRIFPSALVHAGLRATKVGFAAETILYGFAVLNGFAVLIAVAAWSWIARLLNLDRFQFVLGAASFFINFCFLKYNSFYPITTDVVAFTLSLLMILSYLRRAQVWLLVLSVLGAFSWPILLPVGVILLALPRDVSAKENASIDRLSQYTDRLGVSSQVAAVLLGVAATLVAAFIYYGRGYVHPGAPIVDMVAPLSIAFVGLYSGFACVGLLPMSADIRAIVGRWREYLGPLLLATGLFLVIKFLFQFLASSQPGRNTFGEFLLATFSNAIKEPGVFLVAHFAFFGPVVVLALFKWIAACRVAQQFGPGYVAVTLISLGLAIGSESRQLMANVAFLIIPVIAATRLAGWRVPVFLGGFIFVGLVLSRIWIDLDVERLVFAYAAYLEYPWQWFFGAIGYWMTPQLYVIHLAAMMAAAAFMGAMLRSPRRELEPGA